MNAQLQISVVMVQINHKIDQSDWEVLLMSTTMCRAGSELDCAARTEPKGETQRTQVESRGKTAPKMM